QRRNTADPVAFRPPGSSLAPSVATAMSSTQMSTSWARPWVERALELGVPGLEPSPDGSAGAGEIVTRAHFARVVEGILSLLTREVDLMTRYVGEASRFPDVRADHFGYNAIALSIDRGIMRPDPVSGRFRPEAPVSGAEALLIIRELQNVVRMEF
ncbi:MAG: S-layer homology domain-containing protein, partial [Candidatus Latescibacterota bacterium]